MSELSPKAKAKDMKLAPTWTSFAAFMLILLLCSGADSVMEWLGPVGFMTVCSVVLAAAWLLIREGQDEETDQ